jgi:hypothetical protein
LISHRKGKDVLVTEGGTPMKDGGIECDEEAPDRARLVAQCDPRCTELRLHDRRISTARWRTSRTISRGPSPWVLI